MCIIAAVRPGLKLDKETFDRCWNKNPDGFGMAYLFNGELRIKKTMRKDKAWNIYNGVTNMTQDTWMILHFRIGTHGTKDLTNCHPFRVHDGLVFCHNGVIRQIPDCPDRLLNDTQMFNNLILRHLPKDFYKWEHYKMLIEEYIGYSKLVFLDTDNQVYIYNENKGEWHDGIWFSNSGYKEIPKYVPVKVKDWDDNKDWRKRASDRYDAMYPYQYSATKINNDRIELTQCEYCCCHKSRGKTYDNVGFLCEECINELKDMDIDPTNLTLDQIVECMFNNTSAVDKDDVQIITRDGDTSVKMNGRWISWDEYMQGMGYYHWRD